MSKFTDRLWQELMREHRAQLEQIDRPAAERRRRAFPRLVAGTSVGLAGAGTAIALAIGAASSTPAFAVTKHPDGTVSVTINRLTGVKGANQKLAQIGVRAVAVPVEAGCAGAPPPAAMKALLSRVHAAVNEGGTVRIDPREIPRGKRLVLAAGPGQVQIAQLHGARAGFAPACFRYIGGATTCGPVGAIGPTNTTGTNTTDTDTTGTDTTETATAPPETTTATTGTATTGATATPLPPARGFVCAPPPCPVAIAGPATNTTNTDTTTAPTNTDTTTAPANAATAPGPGGPHFFKCGQPVCATAQVQAVPAGKGRAAFSRQLRANQAALRKQLVAARAALARARALARSQSKSH